MIIDFHTHTFPNEIASASLEKLRNAAHIATFTDGTVDGLVTSMRAAGVNHSIILPVATKPRQVPRINDLAARMNERVGENGLFSFGSIHPDFADWREELARVASLGLKGVKIHPAQQKTDLDDPRFLRILTRAGELGLIVVTHAGVDVGYPKAAHCSPAMIRRAVDQAGPVKLVAAHMGGWKNWEEAEELLEDTEVYLDTSFSTGCMTPLNDGYYASAQLQLLDAPHFLRMVRTFGAHRILFGTDSPWSGQTESIDWIRALPLDQAEKDAILGNNAKKLLEL